MTTGQYANATLTITPPKDTPSGTSVTLTIDAKSSASADSNYAVLRLSVVSKVTTPFHRCTGRNSRNTHILRFALN